MPGPLVTRVQAARKPMVGVGVRPTLFIAPKRGSNLAGGFTSQAEDT